MRKILVFTSLLLYNSLTFASSGDTTVIEIAATTLSSVYYHQVNYTTPTKLVFKNLTTVNGSVYFHQNTNLVEVDFPQLQSCEGNFYFNQNTSLQKIIAPNLNTVTDYLYIYGNTALIQLDVCNLKQILSSASNTDPFSIYYSISNNSASVDVSPACFSKGAPANLTISNDSINENQVINSFIGKLSVNSNSDNILSYYLSHDMPDNGQFTIRNDSLLSAITFDYASKNNYNIKITAVNQLGERTEKDFLIRINPGPPTDTTVIEIADTILSSVYYHQTNYTTPTKLVFKNLTTVNGSVYFHQNTNLVEVDLPQLKSCDGNFYFNQNTSLQKIIAPNLNTVTDYLYVYGNTALIQLAVCNLKQILPSASNPDRFSIYYAISNNSAFVDVSPPCFSTGAPVNLTISNDSINENQVINSFVGKLSANGNSNDKLSYYLSHNMPDNEQFTIRNDSLLSATTLDYESKNNYHIKITAVNQLGERLERDFSVNINDLVVEDTVVLLINDTSMAEVYYHHYNFITPTKLVFKNLTRVTRYIYFHQNTNLVEVDFPLLDSTGGNFYFQENESLQKINAPVLNTVYDYLYIYGNTSLIQLNICSLTRILLSDSTGDAYYFISNNKNLNYASTCLTKTNIIYVPVKNIIIKPTPNTLIGHFISDAVSTDNVRYYFVDSDGKETTNPDFVIRGDSLFLTKDFELYTNANFSFDINAIRIDKSQKRTTELIKSLNEKIFLRVNTDISNNIHYSNTWIGLGTTPATSAWENSGNWSSNILPDANTDVIISSGNAIVGTNAICRSLTIKTGANIIVKSEFTLTITH